MIMTQVCPRPAAPLRSYAAGKQAGQQIVVLKSGGGAEIALASARLDLRRDQTTRTAVSDCGPIIGTR